MAKLLREYIEISYTPEMIKESLDQNGGKIILNAILQKANCKNQNGRVYPQELLKREFINYDRVVKDSRALGELDHPESSTVSLDRVSHIVREIWWKGDEVHGKVEILDTPKGQILDNLLRAGVKIGMSSRGVGSTSKNESGMDFVQDDYQLICIDAVSEPSTPGGFLYEGKEINFDPKKTFSRSDRIHKILREITERKD